MGRKDYVFVIAGGPLGNKAFLRSQVVAFDPVGLICADGGARHLLNLGLMPRVIVGDLDSLAPDILKRCEEQGSRIVRFSRDKNETDTQLALEYARELRPDEIRIYGGLGGRIDHTLANISLLVQAVKQGVAAKLVDEWCEAFVVTDAAVIEGVVGQTVSLLPLSSEVRGIDLEGFAYPLAGGVMEIGAPYGISNRLQTERATISIAAGYLLVLHYYRPERFPEGD